MKIFTNSAQNVISVIILVQEELIVGHRVESYHTDLGVVGSDDETAHHIFYEIKL